MNIVFGIIIGLLILMALVVIHELGHFLLARKNGVTRTGMELNVEDIGPSLRFATANVTRIQQQNGFNPNPSGGFSNPNQGVYGGPFAQPQTGWNQPAQTAPQFTAQPAQQAQPGFVDPWATPSPAQQPPVSDNNPTDEPEF